MRWRRSSARMSRSRRLARRRRGDMCSRDSRSVSRLDRLLDMVSHTVRRRVCATSEKTQGSFMVSAPTTFVPQHDHCALQRQPHPSRTAATYAVSGAAYSLTDAGALFASSGYHADRCTSHACSVLILPRLGQSGYNDTTTCPPTRASVGLRTPPGAPQAPQWPAGL